MVSRLSVQLPISPMETWMILLVSRNSPRNIILDFTSIAVWDLLLCPSLNGLFLPERCVLLHTISLVAFR